MIVISSEDLLKPNSVPSTRSLRFFSIDDGDVYISDTVRRANASAEFIPGSVLLQDALPPSKGCTEIVVTIQPKNQEALGWFRSPEVDHPHAIMVVPAERELFSRTQGIYETDVLKTAQVLVIGLGSGGSAIAIELAKAGVGSFVLVDFDRLEPANVARHTCGISDLGRFKTKALREAILDKNPFARVETHEIRVAWENVDAVRSLVKSCDLIFCCTDNRESRTLINVLSVESKRTCIYGGTFSRAYGGHVLRVIPDSSPCYQCFIDLMPEKSSDQEISSLDDAERIAYADRPVPIEPGLSSDIAPISTMCVKVGILELLRGHDTTLAGLYDDLSSCWFQWLNRREQGTNYFHLPPLETSTDSLRILAWYGIDIERNPNCPACGDFVQSVLGSRPLAEHDVDAFRTSREEDSAEFPPVGR